MSPIEFLVVLGDTYAPESGLDDFVSENLEAMGIEPRFANSTDEFVSMDGFSAPHVLVIGSEWNWMLQDCENSPDRPSFRFLQVDGDTIGNSRKFTIHKWNEDGPLFQSHVKAWLHESD